MRATFARVGSMSVALLLLSGCSSLTTTLTAQVPTSGPIQQGAQVGVGGEDQFIRVIARGPSPGMTPTEIVQGFLEASASFDDDHAVARDYLTPQATASWDTNAGVTIYSGVPEITDLAQMVVLTATQAGEIASNGHLDVSPPGEELREGFRLEKVDGEWRISDPPPGLVLSQQDVERAFRSYAVYFFNPDFDMLVPDPRMVPVIGSGLATTLVRRLIAGPSGWLQPAVRTALPPGMDLNIDSVPIEAGVARVDLTADARQMDDQTREGIAQQLAWTLRQIPEVLQIEITAAGQPLTVPGKESPIVVDSWPEVDPNRVPGEMTGFAVRTDAVVALTADGVEPVPGGFGTGELDLVDIAVSLDRSRIAGIDEDGSVWQAPLVVDSQPQLVLEEARATSVAFDESISAWVVNETDGLVAIAEDGTPTPIKVLDLPRKARLLVAVPSRDGTRAALIVRRGPRTVLLVARVVRGVEAGAALTLSSPRRVESQLVQVTDVAWATADRLTVLGAESPGSIQNYDVELATGKVASNGTPETPVSVAGMPGLPTLIGSGDGLVYENDGGAWVERLRGYSPTYPG